MQLTVYNVQYKFFLMTGFEQWTSGIGSDRSTNWATTTAQEGLFDGSLRRQSWYVPSHSVAKKYLGKDKHLLA